MVQLCFSMENARYNKSDSGHVLLDCKRTLETLEWSQVGQWRWGENTAINLFTEGIIKMTGSLKQGKLSGVWNWLVGSGGPWLGGGEGSLSGPVGGTAVQC